MVDKCDHLWVILTVQITADYIITGGGRINIVPGKSVKRHFCILHVNANGFGFSFLIEIGKQSLAKSRSHNMYFRSYQSVLAKIQDLAWRLQFRPWLVNLRILWFLEEPECWVRDMKIILQIPWEALISVLPLLTLRHNTNSLFWLYRRLVSGTFT